MQIFLLWNLLAMRNAYAACQLHLTGLTPPASSSLSPAHCGTGLHLIEMLLLPPPPLPHSLALSLQIGSNFVEFSSVSAFSGFWKRSTEIYCVCCDCFTRCCCCLWAPENETRAWTELGWDLSCVEHLRPWPLSFAAVHLIAVRPTRPHPPHHPQNNNNTDKNNNISDLIARL